MSEPYLPSFKKLDPKDTNPCAGCSNCCEYLAIEIDKPTTSKDFSQIIWYVIHKNTWVYIDHDGSWNIQFNTPCEKLENQRCGYYEYRPMICREYQPTECPRYNDEDTEKFLFKSEVDLWRYLYTKRPKMYPKIVERIGIPPEVEAQIKEDVLVAI